MDEFQQDIQSMEQERREMEETDRQLKDIKRNISGAEQGIKMFEKQLAQLTKQKVTIPAEVTEAMQKAKTTVSTIKKAKTWDEVEAAGLEDLQDVFMSLDEYRQQLEMLSRWPQTVKQAQREVNNLTRELKRAKSVVTRLAKKGIDLSDEYGTMESAVNKLKDVLAQAQAKVKEGTSESIQEAFELLESEFFGQMDDVWEANRIIQTMSNLGQFTSDFKRAMADAKRQIRDLKRRKIDTSELEEIMAEAQARGNEIIAMLKTKPIDEEAVIDALQGMEDYRGQFEEKVAELLGKEIVLPWKQEGPQPARQSVSGNLDLSKFIKKGEESGPTCNINGVEVPGTCEELGQTP
jgi:prefoldin subunit 5/Sec-independent protein translocase protein TatA